MHNNDHTGAQGQRETAFDGGFTNALKNVTESQNNKATYPLTTGRKAQPYKSVINCFLSAESGGDGCGGSKQSFARKLFSPQALGAGGGLISNQILSAGGGKSNEKLMDRFIPCRMGENLQAKFEAVSSLKQQEEELKFNNSQLASQLGLIGNSTGGADQIGDTDTTMNDAVNPAGGISMGGGASGSNQQQRHRRGYSNIFGGISTMEQVNGFARQASNHNNNAREDNHNFENYNNLLEQQIFVASDDQEDASCSERNLSNAGAGAFRMSFTMKENQDQNIFNINGSNGASQASSLPSNSVLQGKLFKFKKNAQQRKFGDNIISNPFQQFLNIEQEHSQVVVEQTSRKISQQPYKVLDAPNLSDDFYLNLVDWSQSNILAVALGQSVYIWNAFTSVVSQLCDLGEENQVTSVAWSQRGSHLCVGNRNGEIEIWDVNQSKKVRSIAGHTNRVGSCSWNGSLIASGSRDRSILVRDIRAQENFQQKLIGHKQEVCGLKWSFHDEGQLASGGNDNKLFIWSQYSDNPLAKFSQHQAAVKAIGWNPQQRGLLATGGGTADQCIRFWNTLTLQPINFVNTGSQVCNLMFSKTNDEIVSTHGYSLNQIIVWKYPSMEKIATLTGHTFRVLYLAMSPDGASIVTGAGDETLRFWNVFPKSRSSKGATIGGGAGIIGNGNSTLFPSSIDFR